MDVHLTKLDKFKFTIQFQRLFLSPSLSVHLIAVEKGRVNKKKEREHIDATFQVIASLIRLHRVKILQLSSSNRPEGTIDSLL